MTKLARLFFLNLAWSLSWPIEQNGGFLDLKFWVHSEFNSVNSDIEFFVIKGKLVRIGPFENMKLSEMMQEFDNLTS